MCIHNIGALTVYIESARTNSCLLEMSSSTCCFCLHPLPSNHRKRMKFHGESCLRAKSIIERLSDGKSYVELSDPHCFFMSVPPTGMNYMYAGHVYT